jgi:ATP-dependent DNA helicase RecQ
MNKSDSKNMQSSPIFYQLKEEKLISSEEYDRLMKVMKKLKYSDFLTREQGMITLKFLRGENVFGVLPTSGGKSFTFQTVARMTEGLTIVISPLIALMKDQVGKHRDGASLYFNSDLSPFQRKDVKRRIREGKVRLLYISPERLKSTDFKELLDSSSQRVKRFVIDEAHCVIEWGYGFRVKYLHIAQEIEAFEKRLGNKIPVLLLTATASPWLQHETAKKLKVKIPSKNFIIQLDDADRPELVIKTQLMGDKKKKIIWLAKQFAKGGAFHKKRGIIFSAYAEGGESNDVHNAPQICEDLQKIGVKKIGYYHGQMNLDERKEVHKKFKKGDLDILVATKAFGMGMDLLGLKFIVHFYPPISLEEYWQEAGRGGRGMDAEAGEYCDCVVLHSPSDKDILNNFTISKGFVNILSTFTCATQDIVCFNVKEIAGGGRLRMLLNELRKQKDIRGLKSLKIGNAAIERWKLFKTKW